MAPETKNGNSLRRSRRLVSKTTAEESQTEEEAVAEKSVSIDAKDRNGRIYLLLWYRIELKKSSLQCNHSVPTLAVLMDIKSSSRRRCQRPYIKEDAKEKSSKEPAETTQEDGIREEHSFSNKPTKEEGRLCQ